MPAQEVIGVVVSDKMTEERRRRGRAQVRHGVYGKMQRRTTRSWRMTKPARSRSATRRDRREPPAQPQQALGGVRVVEKAQEI